MDLRVVCTRAITESWNSPPQIFEVSPRKRISTLREVHKRLSRPQTAPQTRSAPRKPTDFKSHGRPRTARPTARVQSPTPKHRPFPPHFPVTKFRKNEITPLWIQLLELSNEWREPCPNVARTRQVVQLLKTTVALVDSEELRQSIHVLLQELFVAMFVHYERRSDIELELDFLPLALPYFEVVSSLQTRAEEAEELTKTLAGQNEALRAELAKAKEEVEMQRRLREIS